MLVFVLEHLERQHKATMKLENQLERGNDQLKAREPSEAPRQNMVTASDQEHTRAHV